MRALTILGLVLDLVGAIILAWPIFFASDRDIVEHARPRLPLGPTDDDVRGLPTYLELIRQAKFARCGMPLLVAGFMCQLAAAVLQRPIS
jgi:hypothetical protein